MAALKELLWVNLVDKQYRPILKLILQVVAIDPVSGDLVVSAKLVRDLEPPEEQGFGSI